MHQSNVICVSDCTLLCVVRCELWFLARQKKKKGIFATPTPYGSVITRTKLNCIALCQYGENINSLRYPNSDYFTWEKLSHSDSNAWQRRTWREKHCLASFNPIISLARILFVRHKHYLFIKKIFSIFICCRCSTVAVTNGDLL